MLFGQIEAFLEVARSGTMRAASSRLYLSQPAVSARIASLEQELGVKLFDRHRTGMTLSIAGRAFYPHALAAQEAVQSGTRIAKDVAAGTEGEILVGSGPAVSSYVMPELILRFREVCPSIRVMFRTGMSQEIIAMVQQGQLHMGLVMPLTGHDLEMTELYRTDLRMVRSPGYDYLPNSFSLILTSRPSTYYRLAQDLIGRLDLEPRHVIEVDGIETAKRMVLRGLGIALLPSTNTAIELESGELVDIPMDGLPIPRVTAAVEQRGQGDWRPLSVFRELTRQIPEFVSGTYWLGPKRAT